METDACHQEAKDHCSHPCDEETPDSHEEEPCSGPCTCVSCSPVVVTLATATFAEDHSVTSEVNVWVSRMPALDVDHLIWQPPQG